MTEDMQTVGYSAARLEAGTWYCRLGIMVLITVIGIADVVPGSVVPELVPTGCLESTCVLVLAGQDGCCLPRGGVSPVYRPPPPGYQQQCLQGMSKIEEA